MKSARLALFGLPLGAALLLPATAKAWPWPNHDNQSPLSVRLGSFSCGDGRIIVSITNTGNPARSDTFTIKADKQVIDTQQLDPGDDPSREVVRLSRGESVQISVFSELTDSQIFFKQVGARCGGNDGGGGWNNGGGWNRGGWSGGGWNGGGCNGWTNHGGNCGEGCDNGGWNRNCDWNGGRRLPFTGPPADLWGKVATAGGLILTGGIAWWYGSIWPRQTYDGTIAAGRTRSRRRWPSVKI